MSRHRNTRPFAPFPKYLITTYWFTNVTPLSFASFRLVVSLHASSHCREQAISNSERLCKFLLCCSCSVSHASLLHFAINNQILMVDLNGAGARFSATPNRECSMGLRRPSVPACITVWLLLSDTVVSDTVSASSENRSQSELSSSAVPCDGEKVDPSWVSLAAPTEIHQSMSLLLQQSDAFLQLQKIVITMTAPQFCLVTGCMYIL